MDGKRLIEKIRLRNILSFGDKGEEIELQPLNIIIGQNASGKSNLVDVIKLFHSIPQDKKGLVNFISRSGGVNEWIWKGAHSDSIASLEVRLKANKRTVERMKTEISYSIDFSLTNLQRLYISDEWLKIHAINSNRKKEFIINRNDIATIGDKYEEPLLFNIENLIPAYLKRSYDSFKEQALKLTIYTDLQTNRASQIRKPQAPDALNDFLEATGSNLALVLNDLDFRGETKGKIVENLKKFNPRIKDYSIRILGGTIQLFIREEGLEKPISAMRLSDGTLRYLCLLAILCHPEPPPLICIEEPETGLHPDILPTIAELMKEASARTQLIVTTHSDILVSAFSDMPEAVLVCEKDEDGTHFRRLEAEKLKAWLEEYTLGEAWLRGAIGGTRW
jgi:predicted ATPase